MLDERGGSGYDPPRASPVAAQCDGARGWKADQESLEAGSGGATKTIDRLVVITDHEWIAFPRHQLDQPLLGQVQVLVLIDQNVREARRIAPAQRGVLLQKPDREHEQIIEVEELVLPAIPLVSAEEPDASAHEVGTLLVIRGGGPGLEPLERNELLFHTLEHLERRRDQIVRPLVSRQRGVADAPHQLSGQDPAIRAHQDPKAWGHPDRAAVLPQPGKRD